MIKEFEGKSEKEAIDNAVAELNLDREQFDVEIMESNRGGLFRKGNVKIRVYIEDDGQAAGAKGEDDSQIAFGLGKDSGGAPGRGRGGYSRSEGIVDRFVDQERVP